MKTRQNKVALWLSALAFVLACLPSPATAIPTPDPSQINQFIAQTADAARTQTARAVPSITNTPTVTSTSTASPTFTATVIFELATPTSLPTETATFSLGGGGTSDDDFACEVLSINPVNGTTFNGGTAFDVAWKVKNIGQRKWNDGAVDLVFESGTRMHRVASYELGSDVSPGRTITLAVEMEAPLGSGNYTTTWVLRRGNDSFCELPLSINVR